MGRNYAGGEKGQDDASMKELVGVSQVAPPPSAFASAQPPRSVFADAQMPASDSEADPDSARSRRASTDAPVHPKAAQACPSRTCPVLLHLLCIKLLQPNAMLDICLPYLRRPCGSADFQLKPSYGLCLVLTTMPVTVCCAVL